MSAGIIGLALGGANLIQQRRQSKKQEAAQAEGNAVSTANEKSRDLRQRRRNARQERIRRARLLQSSQSSGSEGSSGQLGASSAISANFGSAVAAQAENQRASEGLTAASEREARAISRARRFQAFTDLAQEGLKLFNSQG